MNQRDWKALKLLAVASLGVVFCVTSTPARAQQDQAPEDQTAPSTDSQAAGQQDSQAQAPAAPAQEQPDGQQQDQQAPPAQAQPETQQAQGPQDQAVPPATLTLPAGTVIRMRVDEWISSDRNVIGDNFSGELDQPIVVNGWVVARRGQAQTGRVTSVKKGKGGGASQLGVDLPNLTLVDGQQLPLQTQLYQTSTGPDRGRQVGEVGATTGIGAVIGAIAGGGTGAAIGAGVGATAGVIGVMSTEGRPTVIPPETVLSFRLQAPVTISTEKSQLAFRPVTQSDYDSHTPQQRRPRMARPGPPPAPYYPYPYAYGYPYPYGWYPAPFVGFGYYGRYGWR